MGSAGATLILFLLGGVSRHRIFATLAEKYPTEQALTALFASPEFNNAINDVATMFEEIQGVVDLNPDITVDQIEENFPQAQAACKALADYLGVDVNDLLSVLLVGWRNPLS